MRLAHPLLVSRAVMRAAIVGAFVALTAGTCLGQPTLKDLVQPLLPATAAPSGSPPPTAERAAGPASQFDRSTPRAAVRGFLDATDAGDYQRAAAYLDARQLSEKQRGQAARRTRAVLDRQLWIDPDSLSDAPAGAEDDGLPRDRESLGWLDTPDGPKQVILERVRREGASVWLFSPATVATASDVYQRLGYGALTEWLPAPLREIQFLDVRLWQWIALILLAGVAYFVAWLCVSVAARIVVRVARHAGIGVERQTIKLAAGPARLLVAVALFSAGTLPLGLAAAVRVVLGAIEELLIIGATTWLLLRALDLVSEGLRQRLQRDNRLNAVMLVSPGRRTAKVLVVGLAIIATLDNFGFNVTALLAGLGVGGIAVALAAQKSVENLFGGITLYADQPVRVGDFCRFGSTVGTIEDIGLRSTRVRTLERTLISVPNGEFASLQLENFSRRDKFWYHPTIGLRYETSPDQVRYVLVEVQRMLHAHPMVEQSGPQIRFMRFGAYSLDLEVFAYVTAGDFDTFKEVTQDLNLRIMDIVARSGSDFAFPSQTTYLESGQGLDPGRVRDAEDQVRVWREANALYLPRFPAEKQAELRNTLRYPGDGSAEAATEGDGAGGPRRAK